MERQDLIIGKTPNFSQPILFLDFDDVLNIFDDRRDNPDDTVELIPVSVPQGTLDPYGYPIEENRNMTFVINPDIVERIKHLNAVWLTSWKNASQDILNKHLGTDFGYVDWYYRGTSDGGEYGKMLAIQNVVRTYKINKFAVVDDSFGYGFDEALAHGNPKSEILVIAPEFGRGLSLVELEQLEEFLSCC